MIIQKRGMGHDVSYSKTVGEIVREQAQLYPAQEAYIYPEHGIRKT